MCLAKVFLSGCFRKFLVLVNQAAKGARNISRDTGKSPVGIRMNFNLIHYTARRGVKSLERLCLGIRAYA